MAIPPTFSHQSPAACRTALLWLQPIMSCQWGRACCCVSVGGGEVYVMGLTLKWKSEWAMTENRDTFHWPAGGAVTHWVMATLMAVRLIPHLFLFYFKCCPGLTQRQARGKFSPDWSGVHYALTGHHLLQPDLRECLRVTAEMESDWWCSAHCIIIVSNIYRCRTTDLSLPVSHESIQIG